MGQQNGSASIGRKNGKATESRWEAAFASQKKGHVSWSMCGAEDLLAVVAAVTEDGAALLLSKTSDGGALLIQVLEGEGRKPKFYAASMAELNEVLFALAHVE